MNIVVIGGTGLIGSKTISLLRSSGHDAPAAAPDTGVDTVTDDGLESVMDGAAVVIDLANSRSFEPAAAMALLRRTRRTFLPQKRAPVSSITSYSPSLAPIVRRTTDTFERRLPRRSS